MNLDIVVGFGGWTLLFLGAVAFGAIGLWVDAARQRALRDMRAQPGTSSAPTEAEPPG
jgi:hypothetical protein